MVFSFHSGNLKTAMTMRHDFGTKSRFRTYRRQRDFHDNKNHEKNPGKDA